MTGYVDAYDAATGKQLWRTYTTPQPGDPNRKTWEPETAADYGGAPTWMTGTYDANTKTLYWTTGNPGPDYDGTVRGGDNLYSCSVIALDPETGRMKWWFQFTPHDVHDWDGNQTPMLIDGLVKGRKRKLLVTASEAFYYVLDPKRANPGRAAFPNRRGKRTGCQRPPLSAPHAPTPAGNPVCPVLRVRQLGFSFLLPATNFSWVRCARMCELHQRDPEPVRAKVHGWRAVESSQGTPGAVRALYATRSLNGLPMPIVYLPGAPPRRA